MKTSELTGPALDWAVAKGEGMPPLVSGTMVVFFGEEPKALHEYTPSTDWSQGGPIIEREGLSVIPFDDAWWEARCAVAVQRTPARFVERRGPTPLIAAMRCFVASHLGDEVDVPDELL